ncbi:MAG: HAMP domain-containing sensor histidine kinase, partial [Bacteroidetes bacterium]|nr:HAMP domain-containing sensor histidine kinase [Bacteroidota bacterium]
AHDLRGPFSAFLGYTQMMAEELPSLNLEQIQKIALRMRNSASSLYTLLENLLEWSRLERNLIPFDPSNVKLMTKISESMLVVLESAQSKEITLHYEVPESFMVYADGNMLCTILRNLVTNAVKFTPRNGHITVSAIALIDNSVRIAVKDSGIGMDNNMIADLYNIEGNTNRKGTEGEPSSGLGLIICREFVEKHSGKIWAESEVGKGSTFFFTLPFHN